MIHAIMFGAALWLIYKLHLSELGLLLIAIAFLYLWTHS